MTAAEPLKLVLFFMAVVLLWSTVFAAVLAYRNPSSVRMPRHQVFVFAVGRAGRVLLSVIVMVWAMTERISLPLLIVSIALSIASPILFLLERLRRGPGKENAPRQEDRQ